MLESLLLHKPVIFFGQHHGPGSALADCENAGVIFIEPDWLHIAEVLNKALPDAEQIGCSKIQLSDEFVKKFVHKWDGGAASRIVNLINQMAAKSRIHLNHGIMQKENNSCR